MKSEQLIQSLIEETKQVINKVENLKTENLKTLKWKSDINSWNILECLEHLNLYGKFYLHEIEKSISNSNAQTEEYFKYGFLGNYFAKSMLPKEKLNKMKTFNDKNPSNSNLDKQQVFDEFINQQLKMVELLHKSRKVSLNKTKVKTTLSTLFRIKLGDAFQFVINHNLRHLKQIEKIKSQLINA